MLWRIVSYSHRYNADSVCARLDRTVALVNTALSWRHIPLAPASLFAIARSRTFHSV